MLSKKPAVPQESAARAPRECPVDDPVVEAVFKSCIKSSRELSHGVLRFLEGRTPEGKAKWLKESVESGRIAFQPWNMEILFVLAVQGRARFTELQALLGASSRTLSDKLQALREAGFVERTVYDEQPVRIEYALTLEGRRVAALATPLFTELNRRDARGPLTVPAGSRAD